MGWTAVLRVVGASSTSAAEVETVSEAAVFRCAAVGTVRDGLLHDGVEYWVTVGGDRPPERRTAG